MNIGEIQSFMVGALVDQTGEVRGIIQLLNKDDNGSKEITEDDKKEFAGILPILGEVIRTADEASEVTELCCCKS